MQSHHVLRARVWWLMSSLVNLSICLVICDWLWLLKNWIRQWRISNINMNNTLSICFFPIPIASNQSPRCDRDSNARTRTLCLIEIRIYFTYEWEQWGRMMRWKAVHPVSHDWTILYIDRLWLNTIIIHDCDWKKYNKISFAFRPNWMSLWPQKKNCTFNYKPPFQGWADDIQQLMQLISHNAQWIRIGVMPWSLNRHLIEFLQWIQKNRRI